MEKLKRQRVWVCWKYVSKGGRMTKVPFTHTGRATGTSPEHGGEWTDYETAHAAAQTPEMGYDGIGFVMKEGYFLLDVDHKDMDGQRSSDRGNVEYAVSLYLIQKAIGKAVGGSFVLPPGIVRREEKENDYTA